MLICFDWGTWSTSVSRLHSCFTSICFQAAKSPSFSKADTRKHATPTPLSETVKCGEMSGESKAKRRRRMRKRNWKANAEEQWRRAARLLPHNFIVAQAVVNRALIWLPIAPVNSSPLPVPFSISSHFCLPLPPYARSRSQSHTSHSHYLSFFTLSLYHFFLTLSLYHSPSLTPSYTCLLSYYSSPSLSLLSLSAAFLPILSFSLSLSIHLTRVSSLRFMHLLSFSL